MPRSIGLCPAVCAMLLLCYCHSGCNSIIMMTIDSLTEKLCAGQNAQALPVMAVSSAYGASFCFAAHMPHDNSGLQKVAVVMQPLHVTI